MIRLRLARRVPANNAVNMAYVYGPPFTVGDNISLLDLSYQRPENVCAAGGDRVVDLLAGETVDTEDILISNRSILHPDVTTPTPLFYSYRVGRGTYQLWSPGADPASWANSRPTIRREIVVLGRQNEVLSGVDWDIDIAGNTGQYFLVDFYLARRQDETQTFKAKYMAYDGSVAVPNRIEVVNSIPILVLGTDFFLAEGSSGYTITTGAANYAPGVGLFYRGSLAAGFVQVTATQVQLQDDSGVPHNVTFTNKSVADVVAEINELGMREYSAVALSTSQNCRLAAIAIAVPFGGLALRLDQMVHVRYNEETRIQLRRPYEDPTSKPWYPRIDPGEFTVDATGGPSADARYQFAVPEYASQTWSYLHGYPYRDATDDLLDVLDYKIYRAHRTPVLDGTVVLRQDGKNVSSKILDVDLLNGIIFTSETLRGEVTAEYAYEERAFIYTGVDLNTTSLHSPNLFGKYIGIYLTPHKILSANPAIQQTFDQCVRHVVRDTYQEVVSRVDGVLFDDGSDPEAFLLGVLRPVLVSDPSGVKIVDTRTRGGGLKEDIDSTDEPESAFYWDIGRWGGSPFQDKGSLVVAIPDNLYGTGHYSIRGETPIDESGYFCPTGRLTQDFVQRCVDRHIAGGNLALLWPRTGLR